MAAPNMDKAKLTGENLNRLPKDDSAAQPVINMEKRILASVDKQRGGDMYVQNIKPIQAVHEIISSQDSDKKEYRV